MDVLRVCFAALIAFVLAYRGRLRKSLSETGDVAAFVVGFLSWAASLRFGVTLIVFYLASGKATRYGAARKELLEDSFEGPDGNRNAFQVLASSAPAVVTALLYAILYGKDAPLRSSHHLQSSLLLFYMLFFASCAGDTFSSELGMVLPRQQSEPILITQPWRRVPPGTNGGITWQGTLASALGGLVIGITYFICGWHKSINQAKLIPLGVAGGLFGSLIDSFLGALLQLSALDIATGKVKKSVSPSKLFNSSTTRYICGRDVLSGESVNLLANVLTAACAPSLVPWFSAL